MNIFDFGDKAASGCQIPHQSLAYLEPQDIPDPSRGHAKAKYFGLTHCEQPEQGFRLILRGSIQCRLVVEAGRSCSQAAKSYLTKQVSVVGNRNESL